MRTDKWFNWVNGSTKGERKKKKDAEQKQTHTYSMIHLPRSEEMDSGTATFKFCNKNKTDLYFDNKFEHILFFIISDTYIPLFLPVNCTILW